MSFSFFKPSRPKTPQELAKAIKDSLMALDTKTVAEVKAVRKDSSKNIQTSAFHIFKAFVANPSKPQEIKVILARNHEKQLALLNDLSPGKGGEDDQFEEEKGMIIKEIERVSRPQV